MIFGSLIPSRGRRLLVVATSSVALETPILLFLQVKCELAVREICRYDAQKPGALHQYPPQSVLNGAGVFWVSNVVRPL